MVNCSTIIMVWKHLLTSMGVVHKLRRRSGKVLLRRRFKWSGSFCWNIVQTWQDFLLLHRSIMIRLWGRGGRGEGWEQTNWLIDRGTRTIQQTNRLTEKKLPSEPLACRWQWCSKFYPLSKVVAPEFPKGGILYQIWGAHRSCLLAALLEGEFRGANCRRKESSSISMRAQSQQAWGYRVFT